MDDPEGLARRLAHCYILGFEWAVVSGTQVKMASREKPDRVPHGSRLIHLATYKGGKNENGSN